VQRTGSILVVDHEPAIVDLLVEILTDEGYVAYAAPDGAGALAAIAHPAPALILLDTPMPGMSGAALIARVRASGLATVPIVVMTTAPGDAAPLLAQESIECLAKPFNLNDLLACVARYVQPDQAVDRPAVRYYVDQPDRSGVAPLREQYRSVEESL
jgi:CheY-like chemotaxis protein